MLLSKCLSSGTVISVSLFMAGIGKTVDEGVVNEVNFLNNELVELIYLHNIIY